VNEQYCHRSRNSIHEPILEPYVLTSDRSTDERPSNISKRSIDERLSKISERSADERPSNLIEVRDRLRESTLEMQQSKTRMTRKELDY